MKFKLMGNKENYRRYRYKAKTQWLIVAIIIVFGMTIYPTIKAVTNNELLANKTSTTVSMENSKAIKILEIQPGDRFRLNASSTTGVYSTTINVNGKANEVIVQSISMPEFIGKVDQINGKYDIIVIGRNSSGSSVLYKDYSQINDGEAETTEKGGRETTATGNYVENDITEKKANEIIDFIKSGQLVYVDKDIVKLDSGITNSILYKKFNTNDDTSDLKNYSNFINSVNGNEFNLKTIIEKYFKNQNNNRTKITVTNYGGDANNSSLGSVENRNIKFNIEIPEDAGLVNVKLFLDINGDSLFKEQECFVSEDNVSPQENYELKYELPSNFVGLLDWKIEVTKSNRVKSYVVGNMYFKSLDGVKKEIKVLQVHPDNNNLYISEKEVLNIDDYVIKIENITNEDFNKYAGGTLKLNGKYNMIILGFADMYGAKGYAQNQINTSNAINELKDFIMSGQSVMFTHDTIPFNEPDGSIELTKAFRDYIGQSRFVDINRNDESDIYKNYDVKTGLYKDREIPHYELLTNKEIYGYNLNVGNSMKGSTSIYKTNEGLITDYPYKLDDISVAYTHNQWFQLNLEDPDVVPWYTLNGDNASLNKYDVRNSYYTYSKGNLTFSGAGHSKDYTPDELKLFVNTIVKAERGANHNPTINSGISIQSSKNYDVEVPYDNDYRFIATATDIDNDDVNIKVTIEGNQVREVVNKRIKQGDPVEVTIPKTLYKGIDKIITVKIEAEDILGAKAETKIYRIKPTKQPMISATIVGGKGLVGEVIPITINLEKLYETGNKKITNVSLSKIEGFPSELISISNPEEVNFNDNINNSKTYNVTTNTELNGTNINVKLNYKLDGKDIIKDLSIPVYSKKAQITARVQNENSGIFNLDTTVTLKNTGNFNENGLIKPGEGNLYSWPNNNSSFIKTSTYNIGLTTPIGYDVIAYNINNGTDILDKAITDGILVNYDNPTIDVIFKVAKINHGLYKSILGNDLMVQEENVVLTKGTLAYIAGSFYINSNSSRITLSVDNKLNTKTEDIVLYKLENGKQEKLNITINKNLNNYNIIINDTINKFTNILIKYNSVIPENTISNVQDEFINTISINKLRNKDFKFKNTLEGELPDLF